MLTNIMNPMAWKADIFAKNPVRSSTEDADAT